MKTIFFTGKGGVGKSTLSAATAWQIAKSGYKVLAVSLDPAHNLGDIFDKKLGHRKKKFSNNLFLQETNLEKAAEEYLKINMSLMKEVYSYLSAFNMDKYFTVLKYSPGIEEYAALNILETIFTKEEKNFDYIVFDTPPTGLTLRIFALPNVALSWLERLINIRRDILEKRYTIHSIKGKYQPEGVRLEYCESDDNVIKKLFDLEKRYKKVQQLLQGKNNTISVVLNPDHLSQKESERLLDGLNELKLPVGQVFNNKLTETNAEDADKIEKALKKKHLLLKIHRILYNKDNLLAGYRLNENIANYFTTGDQ